MTNVKVINHTFKIRVLLGLKVVPMGRNKGGLLGAHFPDFLTYEIRR